jgi:DtxR family transcriptional regulator, Mn-dependent transcriptional regulator
VKIQESAENYLETILVLQKKNEHVRSIDIANEMGFSKPSISEQMKKFRENGYINVDGNGYITLTDKGIDVAEKVYERHEMIAQVLMDLGVDKETA